MESRKYRFRSEARGLDADARVEAPGEFVELSDGVTHYELVGSSDDGVPVVLMHGFSVPYFIWDPTFAALAEAGFCVLRYDLLGRGYSDRPDVVYDQALYARQLTELIGALQLGPIVDLVGLSMGGAIAVGYTAQHPERVRALVLIDPAGLPMPESLGVKLVRVPWLGEWLFDYFAEKILIAGLAKDFHMREKVAEFQARYRVQMQYRGFKRALLSTLRYGPLTEMAEAYARVGQQSRPVLLIWGRDDQTVPFALSEEVRAAIPHAEFHPIENAGHIPHYEQPDVVTPLLLSFLMNSGVEKRQDI